MCTLENYTFGLIYFVTAWLVWCDVVRISILISALYWTILRIEWQLVWRLPVFIPTGPILQTLNTYALNLSYRCVSRSQTCSSSHTVITSKWSSCWHDGRVVRESGLFLCLSCIHTQLRREALLIGALLWPPHNRLQTLMWVAIYLLFK